MGKIGRLSCIATPGILTVASLLCLLVIFLGGLNKSDANLRSLYFLKADTTTLKASLKSAESLLDKVTVNSDVLNALKQQVEDGKLYDYYEVYLWNYCAGNGNASSTAPAYCSPRKANFVFDPIEIWGLNTTELAPHIPKALTDGLKAYDMASKYLFIAYTVAFWATLAAFAAGFLAIFSRLGSLVTTVLSSVATIFAIVSAAIATVLFSTATGAIDSALKGYGIHAALGTHMIALGWIAAILSAAASMFWFMSVCCCSGRSSHPYSRDAYAGSGRRRGAADKAYSTASASSLAAPFGSASRGYQPLGGQHPHQRGVEMDSFGGQGQGPYQGRETAYEPFRHAGA